MVHICYRYAKLHVNGFDFTLEDRCIVCEYHFYINKMTTHIVLSLYRIVLVCMMITLTSAKSS